MKVLLLLTAVVLVSTAGLFAHRALAETTPLALAAWRLGLAALFFALWNGAARWKSPAALDKGGPPTPNNGGTGRVAPPLAKAGAPSPAPPLLALAPGGAERAAGARGASVAGGPVFVRLLLAGVCLAAHFLVWFASLQALPVARATLLVCTTPLWTMLGATVLRRHTFTRKDGAALLLAALGIVLVTGTAAQPVTPTTVRGDIFATCGGAFFACYLLLMEGMHARVPMRQQVLTTYSAAAVVLWTVLLLTTGLPRLSYSPGVWKAIAGMTLGPQIMGHTLLNASLKHFSPSAVAFAILLEPPLAAILAWAIFGQHITPGQGAGGLLVIAALALALRTQ